MSEAVHKYGSTSGVRVVPIYGGQHIGRQLDSLRRGVDVVVATPGRALDHIRRKSLRLESRSEQTAVLDEADEMLDMGFVDELDAIFEELPEDRQTVLFSATMPERIMKLARSHLNDPVRILIGRSAKADCFTIEQRSYVVAREHKSAALGRILDVESPPAAIRVLSHA